MPSTFATPEGKENGRVLGSIPLILDDRMPSKESSPYHGPALHPVLQERRGKTMAQRLKFPRKEGTKEGKWKRKRSKIPLETTLEREIKKNSPPVL